MSENFILQRLREKFSPDEEAGTEDLTALNYKVGNTSGMDVTPEIPSELAERVGQMAQRAGGEMEIQIGNPSTFYIDREDLYHTVEGLGIDFSIHSDPNVGYASPYQVGEGGGFDGTFNYFTQYLQAFASFKLEAESRSDLKIGKEDGIKIGRINPHVSVSPLPQTEQERAQGVALDPLGYSLSKLQENEMENRRDAGKNIWDNENFLRKFYRLFIVDELEDNEYQLFDRFYIPYSNKIDKVWREKQNETLNRIYENRSGEFSGDKLGDKIKIIRVAGQADPAIANTWLDILEEAEDFGDSVEFEIPTRRDRPNKEIEVNSLVKLDELIKNLNPNYGISELRRLPEVYYYLKKEKLEGISRGTTENEFDEDKKERLWELLQEPLENAIDDLWNLKPDDVQEEVKEGDPRVSLVPINAKIQAVSNHLEIPNRKILEKTFSNHARYKDNSKTGIRQHIENMYAGEKGYFENGDDRTPSKRHENFLRAVADQFEQQMWQESNVFYRVGPAWVSSSEETVEGEEGIYHQGWRAPKFLWKYLVERKHDKAHGGDYDLDLTDPRKDNGYFEALNDREFQMDVAAAVAGTYMWSMFTQVEADFDMEGTSHFKGKSKKESWIDWMNRFGIGINMETMAGQPRQYFKLWRPVHVVAACRAINITARSRLEEGDDLGGKNHMASELDDCPVKFTIDMEHVSSFGVDPIKEMEIWKDREKELLENPVEVDGEAIEVPGDSNRPLAKMLRMYHLTKPGHETSGGVGHTHGPFRKGDKELYTWLHKMVKWGFTRTGESGERASVMYEVGGEQVGTVYQAKLAMDLIELGVSPDELDPSVVDPGSEYKSEKEALIARFFDMDRTTYSKEWAKIEQHAFDPLDGLLEAETFDVTFSGSAALENNNRINEFLPEEYQ
ncbi:MAG: hypothetical protein H8Z69_04840 [Nanohaloarchaea archaeon]|nr:hypothetical protein [Candidatus Nanohaloarchaea archaeon]